MLKEIIIYGIQRNGNHALGNFLVWHDKQVQNNTKGKKSRDDYIKLQRNKIFLNNYLSDKRYDIDKKEKNFLKDYPPSNKRLPPPNPAYGNIQVISIEDVGHKNRFNDIYYNYVDIINNKNNLLLNTKRKKVEKYPFVILRDPFNWFASLVNKMKRKQDLDYWVDLWITYAKLFFLDNNPPFYFPVKYNNFVKNKKYRKRISNFINEEYTEFGLNKVGGPGSSFDKFKYDGNPEKMNIEDRWRSLNKRYLNILLNKKEVVELSEHIFKFNPMKQKK